MGPGRCDRLKRECDGWRAGTVIRHGDHVVRNVGVGVVEYMRGVSEHGRRGGDHGTTELTMRQTPLAGMIRLVRLKLALMLRIGPLHIQ